MGDTGGARDRWHGNRWCCHSARIGEPSAGRFLYELRLSKESPVRADIVDASGRRIRSLLSSMLGEGVHPLEWNGHTDWGTGAPSGLYFLRAEIAGIVATRACTILR